MSGKPEMPPAVGANNHSPKTTNLSSREFDGSKIKSASTARPTKGASTARPTKGVSSCTNAKGVSSGAPT